MHNAVDESEDDGINMLLLLTPCLSLGGLRVTCEYMAHQEGVMCEEVQILSESKEDASVKVKVHARVMGK